MEDMEAIIGIQQGNGPQIKYTDGNRKNSPGKRNGNGAQMGKEDRCSSTECRTFRRRSRGCVLPGVTYAYRLPTAKAQSTQNRQPTVRKPTKNHTAGPQHLQAAREAVLSGQSLDCLFYRQKCAAVGLFAITTKSVQEVTGLFQYGFQEAWYTGTGLVESPGLPVLLLLGQKGQRTSDRHE